MSFLKKLFGQSHQTNPIEPIFPGESFSILKLDMPEGLAFATINKAYDNYQNKGFYSNHVLIELEVVDKNQNGHPVDAEAERLNEIERQVMDFLKKYNTPHLIGRVTRNGYRDLLIYIDNPNIPQEDVTTFFENIQKEREVNFSIQEDKRWANVALFVK